MRIVIALAVATLVALAWGGCFERTCSTDDQCPEGAYCDTSIGECFWRADGGASRDAGGIEDGGGATDAGGEMDGGGQDGGSTFDAGPQAPICQGQLCWERPLPQGNSLTSIWGVDPSSIWMGGFGNTLLRWNGSRWSKEIDFESNEWVRQIHGTSPSDVWAINSREILHFDGTSWTRMDSPSSGSLLTLFARAPDDVWFVPFGGQIYRWDGTDFSQHSTGATELMLGLWVFSASDAWLVGSGGTVLHWNGTTWTPVTSGVSVALFDVWGSGPDDVWIVGEGGTALHWDGNSLQQIPTGGTWDLATVDGSGVATVWAAGIGVLLKWDGQSFSQIAVPFNGELLGLKVLSDEVWLTGAAGAAARLRGLSWTTWAGGGNEAINGFWSSGSGGTWAVGEGGLLLREEEGGWQPQPSPTTSDLTGIWGAGPDDIWIVGASGTIYRWDGTQWASVTAPTTADLEGIWGAAADDVWIAGVDGVYRWDGATFSRSMGIDGGTSISGTGPSDVWVASGDAFHWDGSKWTGSGMQGVVRSIHAQPPSFAYAVGEGGAFWTYGGSQWTSEATDSGVDLHGVWASSTTNVWMVGDGTILHFDGFVVRPRPSPVATDLRSIWGFGPNQHHIGGEGGAIVGFRP